jgi:hypothetical protein
MSGKGKTDSPFEPTKPRQEGFTPDRGGSATPQSEIPQRGTHEQGNPDRLPPPERGIPHHVHSPEMEGERQTGEKSSRSEHDLKRSHEDRTNPRSDHPTGHLGYNRTHLDDVVGPPVEGSDSI